jgi:hypothetical protein
MHNQNEDETLLKVTTSQETIELNSVNTGNIERQSLDSSIAESEKKKKENRSNELKLCLIFLVHSLYLPISLRRIAARFFRFASPHLVSL